MSDRHRLTNQRPIESIPGNTRRELLSFGAYGLMGSALTSLVNASEKTVTDQTHFEPKAKRVIHICLMGGMSHLDSFDYKPDLDKLHGKKLQ